jgi:hypothetical protein
MLPYLHFNWRMMLNISTSKPSSRGYCNHPADYILFYHRFTLSTDIGSPDNDVPWPFSLKARLPMPGSRLLECLKISLLSDDLGETHLAS